MKLDDWIQSYARAWESADEELIGKLFTDDATYRSHPFREPFRGAAEIRDYWTRATRGPRDIRVQMGSPFVDGDRVAVEWWTTMTDDGEASTLPGCLLLRFAADGRCSELREYWSLENGHREPFEGWGS
jgi:ketosteroid isomerase-like protein